MKFMYGKWIINYDSWSGQYYANLEFSIALTIWSHTLTGMVATLDRRARAFA